jgi:G3E family GTPase
MTETVRERLPVSIITGFLGSGKTTLLNRLLTDPAMARSLVIVNEFGEIGIDHLLLSAPSDNMRLIENGCLCCTMRGDLVEALTDARRMWQQGDIPPFDRVIVETTGLADPVSILHTVVADETLAPDFHHDHTLTLVDAVQGLMQLDQFEESVKQIVVADTVVLTKLDLADPTAVKQLRARLSALNPGAAVIEAAHGQVDVAALFSGKPGTVAGSVDILRWLSPGEQRSRLHAQRAVPAGNPGSHNKNIQTLSCYHDQPVTWAGLTLWLEMLSRHKGENLLRVKGLLNVEGQPVVVHAVQTIIHEPEILARWPDAERRSRLVFITRGIGIMELEKSLPSLSYAASTPAPGTMLEAEAYAKFLQAARNFH